MLSALKPQAYSRSNPSPRYRELVAMYQQMHTQGPQAITSMETAGAIMFAGFTLLGNMPHIREYINRTGAQTVLDYGCGKGLQYTLKDMNIEGMGFIPSVQKYWGVKEVAKYDPAFMPFSALPTGTYDGVICTDVLEHCPQEDIPWILSELFGYANKFVYANVASYPAKKTLPNGENAHCTIQPPDWWKDRIREAAAAKPDVVYSFWIARSENGKLVDEEFTG